MGVLTDADLGCFGIVYGSKAVNPTQLSPFSPDETGAQSAVIDVSSKSSSDDEAASVFPNERVNGMLAIL
jgi:hypothetical protein